MKKTVKSLIVAASVAAIAGIGAVSFAAWSAGDVNPQTAAGSTGNITTTAGAITVSENNITDSVKLVPYDQVVQVGNNVKMQTFKVKYEGGASADSYTFSMALTAGSSLPLYYKLGTESSAPDYSGSDAAPTGWTAFTGSVTLDLATEQTVNIILVSKDATTHGGQDYTITISAVAK